jgi:hypothetical protein
VFKKASPEEVAVAEAAREAEAAERARRLQDDAAARERAAFLATPGGQAQSAFERGDRVFQYSHPMMSQTVVEIWATKTKKTTNDPSEILNAVSDQGWDIVAASFVFVEDTLQSRDNTWKSGQNVKVKGDTVGYYVFRRCEENRRS